MTPAKKWSFLLSICLFAFQACSSPDEEVPETPDPDPQIQTDEIAPEITLGTISEVIETYTNISVSLLEASTTNTKIFVNETEVYSGFEKNISFSFNPYPFAVGMATLRVEAEDEFGNRSTATATFEIKHLLMTFNLEEEEQSRYESIWIFFNDLKGNLLSVMEAAPGTEKIYTDTLIEDEAILYTIYKYWIPSGSQQKYVRITTYQFPLAERRNTIEYNPIYNPENYFEVDISLNESTNGYSKFWVQGSKYRIATVGGGGLSEQLGILYTEPGPIYLRTDITDGGNFFDGKKENYRYLIITPQDNPPLQLDVDDFLGADETAFLSVPGHDPGSLNFTRVGFETDQDVNSNVHHRFYEVSESDQSSLDYLDLPTLPGLNFYNNTVRYTWEGKIFFANLFGNPKEVDMPDWNINFGIDNDQLFLEANNQLDYYVLRLSKNDQADFNTLKSMIWDYRTFRDNDTRQTAPKLSVPQQIKEAIADAFFEESGLELFGASALDFETFAGYTETVEWLGLNKEPKTPDELSYKQVSFFPVDNTGKNGGESSIPEVLQE